MARLRAQPSRVRTAHLPAPVGGVNTIDPGSAMDPRDCLLLFNMVGAEYGLRTRLGWREWCTGLGGQVRTLVPFTGSHKDGSTSKLFACTEAGIWDVTASSAAPTKVVNFGTQNADAGWGAATAFVTIAGHFLVYCDEANGGYVYEEATNTWTKYAYSAAPAFGQLAGVVNGTNIDPARLAYVCSWKNMLWFVERDTARAWYLPVGQISGTAKAFTFGSKFKAGGDLRCLASWTFDGGAGLDDALVAISGAGDVLVYKGTNPDEAGAFGLSGVWFVGSVPAGRRVCTDFGGDLLVMSSIGIVPLSKLLVGSVLYDRSQYATHKVSNLFNQLQAGSSLLRGWAARIHPLDATLLVLAPRAEGQPTSQLAMSLATKGWGQYRGMPMGVAAEAFEGTLFFGTEDGRVCVNDGYLDGLTLADPNAYTPVEWSLLTSFQNLGVPNQKRVQLIRPTFLSQGAPPSYQAQARYRWDLTEAQAPNASVVAGGSVWDTAKWDQAIWGGAYQAQQRVFGATGLGPEAAIAIRGSATARMTLVGIDVVYEQGGIL